MIRVYIDSSKTGGHKNLFLLLGEIDFQQKADTYYFALDNNFMKEEESSRKVALNLKYLLEFWIKSVANLQHGEFDYLPFDFSDQYIGCLRVEALDNEELRISYGFTTEYEGSGINPSKLGQIDFDINNYENTTSSFRLKKEAFIKNIKQSQKEIMGGVVN